MKKQTRMTGSSYSYTSYSGSSVDETGEVGNEELFHQQVKHVEIRKLSKHDWFTSVTKAQNEIDLTMAF